MIPTRFHQRVRTIGAAACLVAILLTSLACPAFNSEFGEIGVPELRSVRDQTAQTDAIIELRLIQLLGPVLRSQEVDCWIIVWESENLDPLVPLLTLSGTAPEGRAVLLQCAGEAGGSTRVAMGEGLGANDGVYDVVEVEGDDLAAALGERLATVSPSRIAVNRSPGHPLADGLSATNEAWLEKALGSSLAERMVPSGPLVEALLSRHLDVEAPLFGEAARLTVGLLERVLSDEYIVAAGTSVSDLTWAARQLARDMGLRVAVPPRVFLQRSGSSLEDAGSAELDVLLQTGDLVFLTVGLEYLGYITHYGRWVYMLHEEERQAPEWVLDGLAAVANDLEAALPHLRSGLGAEQIRDTLVGGLGSNGADSLVLGRIGFLHDRGIMTAVASPESAVTLLWQTQPVLQPGGLVAVALGQRRAEPSWQEAGVWIALLEGVVVGDEGARLVMPPQRVPYLID